MHESHEDVDLDYFRRQQFDCLDHAASTNPPILHRKESFLHPDHPLHAKFARLTRREEQHGLLD